MLCLPFLFCRAQHTDSLTVSQGIPVKYYSNAIKKLNEVTEKQSLVQVQDSVDVKHQNRLNTLQSSTAVIISNSSPSFANQTTNFPDKFFNKINSKTKNLEKQLDRQTAKYIRKLSKREARLRNKLYQSDSAKASSLFATDPETQYQKFIQKMKTEGSSNVHSMGPEYLPYADSLNVSLAFLNKNPQFLSNSKVLPADIENTLSQVKQLQTKLLDADAIKTYVQQRKEQIKAYLSGEANMPKGAVGILNSYNKQLYYYGQQIRQYREMFNDPDKLFKKTLGLLDNIPVFADFMKQNSFLAGLFNIPGNYGSPDALIGVQTHDQVLALIQSRLSSGGPNAVAELQANLQSATQNIQKMQNKISSLGAGNSSMDMPDFKPDQQKTKNFFKRLEYGTNLQTLHASYYFPTTTEIGLSVGYKINDISTVGLGGSYNIGWGSNIQHINIGSKGASFRSYVDVQAKKSFYFSSGFEYNYQPVSGIATGILKSWQQSGLAGISKIVSMKSKIFKKTKIQFLWDFLSYEQVPRAQAFKFRAGYSF